MKASVPNQQRLPLVRFARAWVHERLRWPRRPFSLQLHFPPPRGGTPSKHAMQHAIPETSSMPSPAMI
eukprot:8123615-Lingulodinium_polyedra.AAC.1